MCVIDTRDHPQCSTEVGPSPAWLFSTADARLSRPRPDPAFVIQHQHAHWARHKKDCKDLTAGRYTQVEQRRRAQDELPAPARVEELAEGS